MTYQTTLNNLNELIKLEEEFRKIEELASLYLNREELNECLLDLISARLSQL